MSGWRRRCGGCGAGVAETQYATASDMGEASLPYEQIHLRVFEHQFVIFEKGRMANKNVRESSCSVMVQASNLTRNFSP